MTPEQIASRITALAGRDVRLRPDPTGVPARWAATVRARNASPDAIAAGLGDVAAEASGDQVVITLTDEQVVAALDRAIEVEALEPVTHRGDRPVGLTRDGGRTTTYAALVHEVGSTAARWAMLRSSDGRQIDCALADLAALTPRNPVFPLLLAVTRLERGLQPVPDVEWVAALTAEWPMTVADARRTARTRPLALHLERLADAVLTWTEGAHTPAEIGQPRGYGESVGENSRGATFAPWTGERLARASRIVLMAGLSVAGISAPARI